ncbi:PREDICTED: NEDD8-activating enzyme E1 regulatory subunit-like [Priapulus caudatus]|uniref:NEDD8-activating enzyme E1 regulatory subunit-like n=1 Tax=Priapulus caudatus TaxID=37621 RepID=A0ABM1FAV6_PRICU|nr:PREDICTED: NEDD8-activating enzyme E1 regulatory subunit-like [Priapulus caudatus]
MLEEKKEFKKLIMGGVIENEDGLREEENFDEAVKAVNTALMPDEIPSRIQEIFKDQTLLSLARLLWDAEVPLLVADSYGFLGYMRLVVKEHAVIESHPDSAIPDLRLLKPFPELEEYADLMDLGAMTKKDHSHTPYIIILLKYLDQWKSEHGGEVPHTYQEKKGIQES